jgi:hypothetical protein
MLRKIMAMMQAVSHALAQTRADPRGALVWNFFARDAL